MASRALQHSIGLLAFFAATSVAMAFGPVNRDFASEAADYPFHISCGGRGFAVESFENQPGVERRPSPLGRAVKRVLNAYGPELGSAHGWRVLSRSEGAVELGAGEPPGMAWMKLTRGNGTTGARPWKLSAADTACYPWAVRNGAEAGEWQLAPVQPANGDATALHIQVFAGACSINDASVRISQPIVESSERVSISFFVRPPRGRPCLTTRPTTVTVELPEPLGDRQLVNGGFFPPLIIDDIEDRGPQTGEQIP